MSLESNIERISYNRAELAQSIGVCPNTIDRMVEENFLPPARRFHKRKFWLKGEVLAFMNGWPNDGGTAKPEMSSLDDDDDWRATGETR